MNKRKRTVQDTLINDRYYPCYTDLVLYEGDLPNYNDNKSPGIYIVDYDSCSDTSQNSNDNNNSVSENSDLDDSMKFIELPEHKVSLLRFDALDRMNHNNNDETIPINPPTSLLTSCVQSTCCICLSDHVFLLVDKNHNNGLTLDKLVRYTISNEFLRFDPENPQTPLGFHLNMALLGPCEHFRHVYCIACLRELFLKCTHFPLKCQYPFTDTPCTCPVFSNEGLEYISETLELTRYLEWYEQCIQRSIVLQQDYKFVYDDYNHFLVQIPPPTHLTRPKKFPNLVLNSQITLYMIQENIRHIVSSKKLQVYCKECHVLLEKTIDCNVLSHCHIETCYFCGFSSVKIPAQHWRNTSTNPHGCPRFDFDLRQELETYKCVQETCFDNERECEIQEHFQGIRDLVETRKIYHLTSIFNSIQNNPILLSESFKFLKRLDFSIFIKIKK